MNSASLGIISAAAITAVVVIAFWRQVLRLVLSVLVVVIGVGLYQVIHLLRR